MALPLLVTNTINSGTFGFVGPFKAPNGAFYFFTKMSATTIGVWKATDPSVSWTLTNDPTTYTSSVNAGHGHLVGDVVHLAIRDGSVGTTVAIKYQTYNTATDTWGTVETVTTGISTNPTNGVQNDVSIIVRPGDGQPVILYGATAAAVMGSNYARLSYKRRTGTNTWSAAVVVDANGAGDYSASIIVEGPVNDRVHFLWHYNLSTGPLMQQRSLETNNTLGTASAGTGSVVVPPNTPSQVAPHPPGLRAAAVSYAGSGGFQYIRFFHRNYSSIAASFTSASGTITILGSGGTSGTWHTAASTRAYVDQTDIWFSYNEITTGDLALIKSTDNGGTWSAPVVAWAGVVGAGGGLYPAWQGYGPIYTRGTNVVIPYLIQQGSNTSYNEYVIRTTGPSSAGTLNVTLDNATVSSDGTVTTPPRTGTLNVTLGNASLVAAGVVPDIVYTGTLDVTLASATLASTGTVRNQTFTGTLNQTLAAATLAGTGKVLVSGTLGQTLAAATLVSAGKVPASGTLSQTLAPASLLGTGKVLVQGGLSVTLDTATLYGVGGVPVAPSGGTAKVWTGSAWADKPAKVWTGSAWTTKPIKVWNGSAWVGA